MAKYSVSFTKIGETFKEAAETGDVPYDDFTKFLKQNAPSIKIQMGKRDPEFVTELIRLSEIAFSQAK
jgi:hypothetical protein